MPVRSLCVAALAPWQVIRGQRSAILEDHFVMCDKDPRAARILAACLALYPYLVRAVGDLALDELEPATTAVDTILAGHLSPRQRNAPTGCFP